MNDLAVLVLVRSRLAGGHVDEKSRCVVFVPRTVKTQRTVSVA